MSQSPKPSSHVATQAAPAHDGTMFGAGGGQRAHRPAHMRWFGRHVKEHCPPTHSPVAFGRAHSFSHAPQFFGSVNGSTHWTPQRSGAPGGQPAPHEKPPPGAGAHVGAAGGQIWSHAPQLSGRERSVSHPSAASWLQSAKPSSHVAIAHADPRHVERACGVEHGVHDPQP